MQSDAAASPFHVAIIMDGNGRWGVRQGRTRSDGHIAGVNAVRRAVEAAPDFGVTALSLFAFSSANWKRPEVEVDFLMRLFRDYLATDGPRLIEGGARLIMLGRRDRLPRDIADQVAAARGRDAPTARA